MSLRRIFIVSLLGLGLLCAAGLMSFNYINTKDGPLSDDKLMYFPYGEGVGAIAARLEQAEVIDHSWHFKIINRILDTSYALKAGEYNIPAASSIEDIIQILKEGKTHQRQIVIPEGLSNAQIIEVFKVSEGLDLSSLINIEEGYLMPDTYNYSYGDSANSIIEQMLYHNANIVEYFWQYRSEDFPLKSKDEVLTLASIIEKEASKPEERRLVAAVFLNRLEKRMRLQTDPTVIYGITGGLPLGRKITRSDLDRDTPYNTYIHYGLPPTPIANPGQDSISAVFNPADVDYLYFVADGTGGHVFAKTLAEHNKNVKKWRKIEAERLGK